MDFYAANTLQVYHPGDQTVTPFYHDPAHGLSQPHFIWNGTLILFQADTTWQIVTRDGQSFPTLLSNDFAPVSVAGTPGGFLYIASNANNSTTLFETTIETATASQNSASTYAIYTLDRPADITIAWVGSLGGGALFTAGIYPTWAQVIGSEGGATPSVPVIAVATGTPEPDTLHEGGTAIVSTTSGDSLNMRTAAGVDFQIRTKLARGTQVTILEGPVEADGFSWWRVKEPSGVEGWVVDFVDGVITLIPRRAFENGEEGSELAANPTMPSLLEIGQKARVTLAAKNDRLRMRNGAGLNFRVIALLPPETLVTVVDGPRMSDSLTWWQIRVTDGSVGWAAEVIGSERALTSTGAVDNSTAVPTITQPPPSTTVGNPGGMIPPLLVAPFDGSTVTDATLKVGFTWSPVPGAATYTLTLEQCPPDSTDETGCIQIEPITGLAATAYTLTLNQTGTYRWSVTAIGSDGVTTSTSPIWKFTLSS
jgi:uncharacterized protein YgiM (DUF1202 family)